MHSPIGWFGGKGMLAKQLLGLLPQHTKYVEVFGGGASLLFAKDPVGVEVYNDLNGGLVNMFRVIADPKTFSQFMYRVSLTLYSRDEYNCCRKWWKNNGEESKDVIEKAYCFFVVARMSFSGKYGSSWGSTINESSRGVIKSASRWLSVLAELPAIHERIQGVQIEHADFRDIVSRYDGPGYLLYADPPYVHSTRRSGKYQHELSDDDHRDLLKLLKAYRGKVMLSGYKSELYDDLDNAGWRRVDFKTVCRVTNRKKTAPKEDERIESVWMNFDPATEPEGLFSINDK